MKITIVIPVWNGEELLKKNISALLKAKNNPKNQISEIIMVDDASSDGSVSFLENFKKEIRIIKHTKNKGFAKTVNRGVTYVKTPLFCLLNQDVIVTENFLVNTIKHFGDKRVFAVNLHEMGYGPATGYFSNGFFQHSNMGELKTKSISMWASGGSAVFRKKIWRKLKGLDEVLFSPFYWEDVDISYRAHKRGYHIFWEPTAHVVHKHESVINEKNFQNNKLIFIKERNYLLFNWKNITSTKLFRKHIVGLVKRTVLHPGYLRVVIAALKRYPDLIKLRRKEIKYSTVSDEAVFAKFVIR